MYEQLKKYAFEETPGGENTTPGGGGDDVPMNGSRPTFKQISIDIVSMSEEWRVMLSVDEIFALYLRDVASKTNELFY